MQNETQDSNRLAYILQSSVHWQPVLGSVSWISKSNEKGRAHRAFGNARWTFFLSTETSIRDPVWCLGRGRSDSCAGRWWGGAWWRMVGKDWWPSLALGPSAEVNPRTQVLKSGLSNRSRKTRHGTMWINIWKVSYWQKQRVKIR